MMKRRENQFKGRPQSAGYAKDARGSSGVFKERKKEHSSSEGQVSGGFKHAFPRTTGRDSRPKSRTYKDDDYPSSPIPARRETHRPTFRGASEPGYDTSNAGYGSGMENAPRKESYIPHKSVPASKDDFSKPVEASLLIKGLKNGRDEITAMCQELINLGTADYDIKEIEVSVSFSASGKLLGFGGRGAASVKIKIGPKSKG
jgi:hypothetical protein